MKLFLLFILSILVVEFIIYFKLSQNFRLILKFVTNLKFSIKDNMQLKLNRISKILIFRLFKFIFFFAIMSLLIFLLGVLEKGFIKYLLNFKSWFISTVFIVFYFKIRFHFFKF